MSIGYSAKHKHKQAEELQKHIDEFLAQGGTIQKLTPDQHRYNPLDTTFMTRDKVRSKKVRHADNNA